MSFLASGKHRSCRRYEGRGTDTPWDHPSQTGSMKITDKQMNGLTPLLVAILLVLAFSGTGCTAASKLAEPLREVMRGPTPTPWAFPTPKPIPTLHPKALGTSILSRVLISPEESDRMCAEVMASRPYVSYLQCRAAANDASIARLEQMTQWPPAAIAARDALIKEMRQLSALLRTPSLTAVRLEAQVDRVVEAQDRLILALGAGY